MAGKQKRTRKKAGKESDSGLGIPHNLLWENLFADGQLNSTRRTRSKKDPTDTDKQHESTPLELLISDLVKARDDLYRSLGFDLGIKRTDRLKVLFRIAKLEKPVVWGILNQNGENFVPTDSSPLVGSFIVKIDNDIIQKAKKAVDLFSRATEFLYPHIESLAKYLSFRYKAYESDVLGELHETILKVLDQIKPNPEKILYKYLQYWLCKHLKRKLSSILPSPHIVHLDDPIEGYGFGFSRNYQDILEDPCSTSPEETVIQHENIVRATKNKFFGINSISRLQVLLDLNSPASSFAK